MPPASFAHSGTVKAVLQRCHLMRPFKFDLPPELWVMIFTLLLEPTVAPYKYCTPDTFPYYRREQFPFPSPFVRPDYNTHYFSWDNRAWRQISLVCRAWASLVGTQPFLDTSSGQYHLRAGMRNMKCSYPRLDSDNPLELLSRDPQISNGLTTLAITQVDHAGNDHFEGVKALLDNYKVFPMLRSLRVDFSPKGDMPQFWNRLEKGFPNLISLALSNCPSSVERITFSQLEVLIIWATRHEPARVLPTFLLPRLKHSAVLTTYFMNSREFFMEHGAQLQSLSFCVYRSWPWSPADFWELFPSLLTLEISAEAAEPWEPPESTNPLRRALRPIPPTHPLRRLVLSNLPIDDDSDFFQESSPGVEEGRLRKILLTIPTIQHLSITESPLPNNKLKALRRLVRQRGITFDLHAVSLPSPYRDIKERYRGDPLKIAFVSVLHAMLMCGFHLFIALINVAEPVLRFGERLKRGYRKLTGKPVES